MITFFVQNKMSGSSYKIPIPEKLNSPASLGIPLFSYMVLCEHPFQSCDVFYFPFTKTDGTEIRSGHGLVILFPQQNDPRSV